MLITLLKHVLQEEQENLLIQILYEKHIKKTVYQTFLQRKVQYILKYMLQYI